MAGNAKSTPASPISHPGRMDVVRVVAHGVGQTFRSACNFPVGWPEPIVVRKTTDVREEAVGLFGTVRAWPL
ncbi:hypothetical protein ACGF5S_17160 [Nocardia nova]|uniref:hypothetical protein n=1 Tax=Nocardia nova TaxID=37330 RepID=UPI00371A42D0